MAFIENLINFLKTPAAMYIAWIVLHYICSHLYIQMCTPSTLYGFITSPIMAPTPHCSAFRWVIYTGGNTISTMWLIIGGWLMHKLIINKTE